MPEAIRQSLAQRKVAVVDIPMNRTQAVACSALEQTYDWIFFTSVNGVRYFDFNQLQPQAKILAIGNQTTNVLQEKGFSVDFQPKEGFSEGLVHEWLKIVTAPQRVFWPHSLRARRVIYDSLTKGGHTVLEQVIYKNEFLNEDRQKLIQLLQEDSLDYVLFASPSAWESFFETVSQLSDLPEPFWDHLKIAAIGPVTAKAIKKDGQSVTIQPEVYDMQHLYQCLLEEINLKE
ncbi:uroporphyrinogen-III synthase [Enterococcus sp. AZ109]|uniref:uroporphyrinogen-III synthase n=1 Tax=Enterococcus sp. AZ109 TaxID=2774634 RepID=UPI003F2261BB